jgi:hypothetical protein
MPLATGDFTLDGMLRRGGGIADELKMGNPEWKLPEREAGCLGRANRQPEKPCGQRNFCSAAVGEEIKEHQAGSGNHTEQIQKESLGRRLLPALKAKSWKNTPDRQQRQSVLVAYGRKESALLYDISAATTKMSTNPPSNSREWT